MDIRTCAPKVQDPSQLPGSLRGGTGASFPTPDRCKDRRPAPGSCLRQRGLPRGMGQPSHTPRGNSEVPQEEQEPPPIPQPPILRFNTHSSHNEAGPTEPSPTPTPAPQAGQGSRFAPETLCLSPQQGPGRGDSRQTKCYSPPPRSCAAASGPLASLKQRPCISISRQFKILC